MKEELAPRGVGEPRAFLVLRDRGYRGQARACGVMSDGIPALQAFESRTGDGSVGWVPGP
jgi:hypothetical protein